MIDDRGMLSIDFLAGFTIFILALIMVINMVPGILVGLESQKIDYDAVAYRTSVILTEDPGWPANPPWELKDVYHKDDIERLGLSVSSDNPKILSKGKIDRFFDPTFFTEEEYAEKVIFADLPYAPYLVNISLDTSGTVQSMGSPVPELSYGYVRRLVKVKEPSYSFINCTEPPYRYKKSFQSPVRNWTVEEFSTSLNYAELMDKRVKNEYKIDPRFDTISITLDNFNQTFGGDIDSARIENVRFYKEGALGEIPYSYDVFDNDTYEYRVWGSGVWDYHTLDDTIDVTNVDQVSLKLYPPLPFAYQTDTIFMVNFTTVYNFTSAPPGPGDWYVFNGTHMYDYNAANVTRPALKDAVLEVAIW